MVPSARDILERLRPSGTPGAATIAGVPAEPVRGALGRTGARAGPADRRAGGGGRDPRCRRGRGEAATGVQQPSRPGPWPRSPGAPRRRSAEAAAAAAQDQSQDYARERRQDASRRGGRRCRLARPAGRHWWDASCSRRAATWRTSSVVCREHRLGGGQRPGPALARRRLGAAGARSVATRSTLADAVESLVATPVRARRAGRPDPRGGAARRRGHPAVAPAGPRRVGSPRRRAGPAGAGRRLRDRQHQRPPARVAGSPVEPAFRLGSLGTAWSRITQARSAPQVRETLARSGLGRPGGRHPRGAAPGPAAVVGPSGRGRRPRGPPLGRRRRRDPGRARRPPGRAPADRVDRPGRSRPARFWLDRSAHAARVGRRAPPRGPLGPGHRRRPLGPVAGRRGRGGRDWSATASRCWSSPSPPRRPSSGPWPSSPPTPGGCAAPSRSRPAPAPRAPARWRCSMPWREGSLVRYACSGWPFRPRASCLARGPGRGGRQRDDRARRRLRGSGRAGRRRPRGRQAAADGRAAGAVQPLLAREAPDLDAATLGRARRPAGRRGPAGGAARGGGDPDQVAGVAGWLPAHEVQPLAEPPGRPRGAVVPLPVPRGWTPRPCCTPGVG